MIYNRQNFNDAFSFSSEKVYLSRRTNFVAEELFEKGFSQTD
jgi:hypothetical protein